MNIVAQNHKPAQLFAGLKTCVLMLVALSLLSCGGGGGDNVSIGSGQGSDPVVVDYPLFYIKKPLPTDDIGEIVQVDVRDLLSVQFGADLYMRVRASVSAADINLTAAMTQGLGDVRDVSVHHDGTKVLFAMRFPIDPNGDEEDQPVWDIWEYDIPAATLRLVMADLITANEGHDIAPHYLPDDRIIFSSTRQSRTVAKLLDAGLTDPNIQQFQALDEEQEEPAFVLHVMEDNGSNLQQISFNQSHDMYVSVLANGRIMFSRWEGMGNKNAISLYSANPDGTDVQLLYGADSHDTSTVGATVEFLKARELRDGRILALLMPFTDTSGGGDIIAINTLDYLNNSQPNLINQGLLTGPAQISMAIAPVSALPGFSEGGRYAAFWPLWDGTNRTLVSWASCLVEYIDPVTDLPDPARPSLYPCSGVDFNDPMVTEADSSYGIWAYDHGNNTQRNIVTAELGTIITDIAIAQPRSRPVVISDAAAAGILDPDLLAEEAGILNIRSVYDVDGTDTAAPDYQTVADPEATLADERTARFLRVYRAVGIPSEEVLPDFDDAAFGNSPNAGMREIVGYVPIEPDGSVRVKVPADVPLSIEVLNKAGHRINPDFPRHQYWLQVRPGEEISCNGCHQNAPGISHGRSDGFAAVNQGAPFNGYIFPNTVSTIFADAGDTMAMARTRMDPLSLELSTDLIYQDVWTDPATGRLPDTDYSVLYADLTATPVPEMFSCVPWAVECRVVINYEEHIQPLWEVTRPEIDSVTGLPAIDPGTGLEINTRCIDCHSRRYPNFPSVDPALIGSVVDPADRDQLELTSNASGDEPTHMLSYEELLNADEFEQLDPTDTATIIFDLIDDPGGAIDPVTGLPVQVPRIIGSPLSAQGAYAMLGFFDLFSATGQHPNWLSAEELRLVAEWLDLGAQYYNDPFSSVP